jgi:hypothetical protein
MQLAKLLPLMLTLVTPPFAPAATLYWVVCTHADHHGRWSAGPFSAQYQAESVRVSHCRSARPHCATAKISEALPAQ